MFQNALCTLFFAIAIAIPIHSTEKNHIRNSVKIVGVNGPLPVRPLRSPAPPLLLRQ